MIYLEAPNEPGRWPLGPKSVFLAGGITGCYDWQRTVLMYLKDANLVVCNPRRENFPSPTSREIAQEQISWEHRYLRDCDLVAIWFPCETLCPITLLELGTLLRSNKPLVVGIHPGYARKMDLEIQIPLYRNDVRIVNFLPDFANEIIRQI